MEAKAWPEKYNDAMKRLASDENKQMIKLRTSNEIKNYVFEVRTRDEEVHKAFGIDKTSLGKLQSWLVLWLSLSLVTRSAIPIIDC